jgi:hypothetical protein
MMTRIWVIGMSRNGPKVCRQGVNVSRQGQKKQDKVKLHFSENEIYIRLFYLFVFLFVPGGL